MIKHPNLNVFLNFNNNVTNIGNGNAVSIVGTPVYTTGIFGKAWAGADGKRVNCGLTGLNSTSVAYTFASWARWSSSSSYNSLFYIFQSPFIKELRLDKQSPAHIKATDTGGVGLSIDTTQTFPQNTWAHLATTYEKIGSLSYLKIYYNGNLVGEMSATYQNITGNDVVTICGLQNGFDFIGDMDNAMLYVNVAFPQSDIRRIMYGLHPLKRS
jgi:hypothetical protein